MTTRRTIPYKETHQVGNISIEKVVMPSEVNTLTDSDFGIQIASDGRVWICINGEAWIRFQPRRD